MDNNILQEATNYVSKLMKEEGKSPEMIVAITGLLKVILEH